MSGVSGTGLPSVPTVPKVRQGNILAMMLKITIIPNSGNDVSLPLGGSSIMLIVGAVCTFALVDG